MALSLNKVLSTNQEVDYWELTEVIVSDGLITVFLKGWKSEQDKIDGAEADTVVTLKDLDVNTKGIMTSVYNRIKQHVDWVDAV